MLNTKSRQYDTERVREHLANERTYLAWMRSAIALMGFGIVIMRLRYSQIPQFSSLHNSWKLSFVFSLISLVTVLLSTGHYFTVRRAIDSNSRSTSSRWIIVFSIVLTLLGTGAIYLTFM